MLSYDAVNPAYDNGLTGPSNQTDAVGASVSLQLQTADSASNALTYQISGLPAGLSFNSSTDVISGTLASGDAVSNGGVYYISIQVTDQGTTYNQGLTWTVTSTATHFVVTAPSTTTAGVPLVFTVSALDANNNVVPNYTGTVHFTSSDANAIVPVNVALTDGAGSFGATLNTAATETIHATDANNQSIAGSASVSVSPGMATQLVVSAPGTVTAGGAFNVTVTAEDSEGNTVPSYSGTVAITGTDEQAVLPASTTLTNGVGTFSVTLVTATEGGLIPSLVTATDSSSGISGDSPGINVNAGAVNYFGLVSPAGSGGTITTGTPFSFTVTAYDQHGNIAAGYTGTVAFTSGDSAANLPSNATLTSGQSTFTITLNTPGYQAITATDTGATSVTGTTSAIFVEDLMVTSFEPTANGFTVTFNKPFIPADLTMYGPNTTTVQDVEMVGANNGYIPGTLYLDPTTPDTINFKATNYFLLAVNESVGDTDSVALPDDTYTVTLVSGSGTNGFVDALNTHLDGLGDGTAGNFTTAFTTTYQDDAGGNANPEAVLGIPDFARGPDSSTTISVPNNKSTPGIPITLYNAVTVQDATFTLTYNPEIFAPTAGGTADSPAGSTFTMGTITSIDSTHSAVTFVYHNAGAYSGSVILGDILATVPNSAASIYKTKELLDLSDISVTGGATVLGADAIHVDAYLGNVNVTASPTYDHTNAVLAQNVSSGAATGFAAYALLDPAIIGGIIPGHLISVDPADVTALYTKAAGGTVVQIPNIPSGMIVSVGGADPTMSLAGGVEDANGIVAVAVLLDDAHPDGSDRMTEAHLALTYDPSVLSLSASDITLGSIPGLGTGWQVTVQIDATTGQIGITIYNPNGTPITASQAGSLVNIAFHVVTPNMASVATTVQLVTQATPNGQRIVTDVDDDQGPLTLTTGTAQLVVQTETAPQT